MILGVQIKRLVTHTKPGSSFREVIRYSDELFTEQFAQWSHSINNPGYYTEEFHIHQRQVDWWYVPMGILWVVLIDQRPGSKSKPDEIILSSGLEAAVLRIPPGVAHGFKVLEGPAHLMYITSQVYNPEDEGRVRLDYDWSKV